MTHACMDACVTRETAGRLKCESELLRVRASAPSPSKARSNHRLPAAPTHRALVDRDVGLDRELFPGLVLARHQAPHLVRGGGARIAPHGLKLLLHLGHRER